MHPGKEQKVCVSFVIHCSPEPGRFGFRVMDWVCDGPGFCVAWMAVFWILEPWRIASTIAMSGASIHHRS